MSRRLHRVPVVVGIVLLALLGSFSAYAAWTTTGRSGATASATTLNPPTGVTASSVPGSGSVSVAWAAPGGTLVPQGYTVQRTRIGGGGTSYACGSSTTSLLVATTCTDSGMVDATYTYVVTAIFSSWRTSSVVSGSVVVTTDVTTATVVTSSASPSVTGQTVTYTATVTPGSGTVSPGGPVVFKDAGSAISCTGGTQTLDTAGKATCQVAYTSPGTHTVTASYARTAGFAASTSAALGQTVSKAATTTTLTSTPNPARTGQTVTYTASVAVASPGAGLATGTVAFSDGGSVLTCSGGNQTLNATGVATCQTAYVGTGSTHSVTATYSGDSGSAASTSAVLSEVVNQAATSTTLTSSVNPAVVGQTVTLTATVGVTSPGTGTATGTVTFKSGASTISCSGGNQTLSSGSATCRTALVAVGTSTLTAVYSGDTGNAASTSAGLSQVVNAAATTTSLASSANPSVPGQAVTFTATVSTTAPGSGTPSGTVTFKDGASTITCTGGSQTLSAGVATCSLTYSGSSTGRSITAVYGGTSSYLTSTSAVLSQVVTSATSTTVVSSTSTIKTGTTVTFTATVAATLPGTGVPTGTVAFKDGGTALTCTGGNQTLNASGVATCSVSFASYGNHAVTATYAGATGYATSTSGAVTQKVVSSAVTGLVFTGIGGANTGSSCSGPVGSSYSCSVSAPSSATVSASVAFAGATGSPMVYSADPQTLGYTVVGKSTGSGSVTVTGATSTSSTPVSTTKQGSNSQTITVTFSDGLSSFTAVLTVN